MDSATADGHTLGDVEPLQVSCGGSRVAEGPTGQTPETLDAATARATAKRTPKAAGDAGTPKRDDRGSAIPVKT